MSTPFLLGLPGLVLSPDDEARLQRINPAGIVLFARNCDSVPQIKALIISVKELLGGDRIIAIDHEGGRTVRFPEGLPLLPSARTLGTEGDRGSVRKLSLQAGKALRDWGVNMNFAPVTDIAKADTHSILSDRCYSDDAEVVAEMAVAFIEGMHDAGIKCTAKHFPGLGSAVQDTHVLDTVVPLTLQDLETEWIPFRAAINAGVDAIMISHANYPALDPEAPATLSRSIITNVLRKKLGFSGLILTDDMEMGAILENFTIEDAVQRSISAGSDLALLCRDPAQHDRAFAAISESPGN